MKHSQNNQKGFTLVELAIVLVIIGLIVGGVLVGQDLIKAAEIRATISQIEKLNTSVNAFRGKYNGLPGDSATGNTFLGANCTNGDGNGLVTDALNTVANASTDFNTATAELINVFSCLSSAGMVDGSYDNSPGAVAAVGTGLSFPASKMGRQGLLAFALNGRNQWHIGLSAANVDHTTATTFADALSPNESLQIDTKMDDAAPGTGGVLAVTGTAAAGIAALPAGAANDACLVNTTPTTYNVGATNADADTVLCQLRMRWN